MLLITLKEGSSQFGSGVGRMFYLLISVCFFVPKGATNRVCSLFASLARILIVYQDPQKVGFSGTTGPTDHSFDRTGCQLHTDLKYQSRPDINPENSSRTEDGRKLYNLRCSPQLHREIDLESRLNRDHTLPSAHDPVHVWEWHGMAQ
jgi:hypothetical protein